MCNSVDILEHMLHEASCHRTIDSPHIYAKAMAWRPDVAAMLALGIPRVLILVCYLLSCRTSSQFDSLPKDRLH